LIDLFSGTPARRTEAPICWKTLETLQVSSCCTWAGAMLQALDARHPQRVRLALQVVCSRAAVIW